MTTAIYAGSFDPITNGHIDIIKRSMQFCDKLIVAIGVNPAKKTMFSEEERIELIKLVIAKDLYPNLGFSKQVDVTAFNGLMVNLAKEKGASVLIRGIRSVSDFEYEINLANINKVLAPGVETVFLPTQPEMAVVSSSAVKEIAKYEGDVRKFAPSYVVDAVSKKFGFVKTGE